jgi:hypothetical protein
MLSRVFESSVPKVKNDHHAYLTKFVNDKPVTIDFANLKQDIRAYVKPLFNQE